MEGVSGHAASQRSVIGEHRSEADARASAAHERARLEVIHGDGADAWRIVVMRDGELVAEERPRGRHQDPPAPVEPAEPAPTEAQEWPDMDMSGPVPEWVISRVEDAIARRRDRDRPRDEGDDGTPTG